MIKDWVEEVLQRHNLGDAYSKQRVLILWEKAVGNQVARLTRAERFLNGTLYVATSSPTVAQELSFFKARYIERVNTLLGEEALQEIRFVPGQFRGVSPKPSVDLSDADRETAHQLFSALMNCELRRSFERLYLTARRRELTLLARGAKRCPACGVVFTEAEEICPGCRFGGIVPGRARD